MDMPTHPCGPTLCLFRDKHIQDVWNLSRVAWKSILDSKTTLPSPYIRLFEDDRYIGRRHFPSGNDEHTTIEGEHATIGDDPSTPNENVSHLSTSTCITPPTIQMDSTTTPSRSTSRTSTHLHSLIPQSKVTTTTQPVIENPCDDTILANETENAKISCEIPHSENEMLDFKSKAAIQISKAIGRMDILKEYDTLRTKLKGKSAIKGYKPSPSEKKRYNELLSHVHTQVLSTKHKLKVEIKRFETNYYCKHGMLPTRTEVDYVELRNKLDYTRKLLSLWHNFDL